MTRPGTHGQPPTQLYGQQWSGIFCIAIMCRLFWLLLLLEPGCAITPQLITIAKMQLTVTFLDVA